MNDTVNYVDLYDVIDAYPHEMKINKIMTRKTFEEGVNFFVKGDLVNARKKFIDVIKIDKNDKLAQSYIFMCDDYKENNGKKKWTGFFDVL